MADQLIETALGFESWEQLEAWYKGLDEETQRLLVGELKPQTYRIVLAFEQLGESALKFGEALSREDWDCISQRIRASHGPAISGGPDQEARVKEAWGKCQ